jgi:hypothetical protein
VGPAVEGVFVMPRAKTVVMRRDGATLSVPVTCDPDELAGAAHTHGCTLSVPITGGRYRVLVKPGPFAADVVDAFRAGR